MDIEKLKETKELRQLLVDLIATQTKLIKRNQDEIAKIDARLAEAEPELRHGDYGHWSPGQGNEQFAFLYLADVPKSNALTADPSSEWVMCNSDKKTIIGNIFDDLAALQEDVEEVKFKSEIYNGSATAYLGHSHNNGDTSCRCDNKPHDMVHFRFDPVNSGWCSIEEFRTFILGLRQMVATQQRKAAK